MNFRLLSLLTMIQDAVSYESGRPLVGSRLVNFHTRIARLVTEGGGSIQVQGYKLADGRHCVKVALSWPQAVQPQVHSIYPTDTVYDWDSAVIRIARSWAKGAVEAAAKAADLEHEGARLEAAEALDNLEAAG